MYPLMMHSTIIYDKDGRNGYGERSDAVWLPIGTFITPLSDFCYVRCDTRSWVKVLTSYGTGWVDSDYLIYEAMDKLSG